MQVINQQDRRYRYAKLLGYFEGKDSRLNLEQIFGPLLVEIQNVLKKLQHLELLGPEPSPANQVCLHCSPQELSKCMVSFISLFKILSYSVILYNMQISKVPYLLMTIMIER